MSSSDELKRNLQTVTQIQSITLLSPPCLEFDHVETLAIV